MKTLFVQYHSGMRQVITDTTENLLDYVLMEIENIEDAELIEHIDKRNEVKAIRERLGLTQQQLAEKIGLSATTIIRWEQNKHAISEDPKEVTKLVTTKQETTP
jgi:DNA-binding XRE family transcriptional regulator